MVKRGKIPKITTSLSNKLLFKMSKNLAKKGGLFSYGKELRLSFFARYVIILGAYE